MQNNGIMNFNWRYGYRGEMPEGGGYPIVSFDYSVSIIYVALILYSMGQKLQPI